MGKREQTKIEQIELDTPKVLGLDVSTKTIGFALFDIRTKQLLELTHVSPTPKPKVENKIEELILKSNIFREKLINYVGMGITSVVIEEPLLNSNNVYTVGTLIRFNTLICKEVHDILGVVPEFISTYNSRKFAFPHLVQQNDKGKHVLFGGFPKDIDKKVVIWELVAKREPQITWQYTKNNTLKKENYDQTDAYCAALGYMKMQEIW
jgi:RNase H-fold protein (predicted Holliday junction resolvase)